VLTVPRKIPVIVGSADVISGVTSWAFQLKEAFKGHDQYEVLLFNIKTMKSSRGFDLSVPNFTAAYQLLDDLAPVIVIPNAIWTLFPVGLNSNIRCVGICHADSEVEYYAPLRWYEPLIVKFIGVSPECTRKLKYHLPNRVEDITTLVYGISVPAALERSYHVNPIRLVYGGRIVQQQKRVFDFISLVENLLELQVDFVLDIVGDGPDLAALKEMMSGVAHSGRVHFLGRQPPEAMADIWLNHDIFVQVSEFEGTSVSMLEAMAQGTVPVITETESGATSVITPNENGFLAPIGNMQAMAQIIADLASKPVRLQTIGQAAFNHVKRFSIQTYVEAFSAVLDQALASPPARWPYERCLMPPSSSPLSSLSLPFEAQQEVINHLSSVDVAQRVPLHKLVEAIGFKISNQLNQRLYGLRGWRKRGWRAK
jgi:glycosyltransferase involved in cell wall biosynthesis